MWRRPNEFGHFLSFNLAHLRPEVKQSILILIVGSICFYLFKQKKKGNHCIGCPYAGECKKKDCEK
jgi:hypothetical protein